MPERHADGAISLRAEESRDRQLTRWYIQRRHVSFFLKRRGKGEEGRGGKERLRSDIEKGPDYSFCRLWFNPGERHSDELSLFSTPCWISDREIIYATRTDFVGKQPRFELYFADEMTNLQFRSVWIVPGRLLSELSNCCGMVISSAKSTTIFAFRYFLFSLQFFISLTLFSFLCRFPCPNVRLIFLFFSLFRRAEISNRAHMRHFTRTPLDRIPS